MRVTVSHNKPVNEVMRSVDQGFDTIFQGIAIGAVQFSDQKRSWDGQTLNFSFTARAGFLNVPLKGWVLVEDKNVVIDIDLPGFLNNLIPEAKVKAAIEGQVKGLLA